MSPNELLRDVFIHDGGNVERKDTGETEFPKENTSDISTIATAKFKDC